MEAATKLEPVVDRLQTSANVKSVFGQPFESHGKTLVPVANVAYGFGGGNGTGKRPGPDNGRPGEGGGMGGGVKASPVGVLEVTDDMTRFVRFGPDWRLIGVSALCLLLGIRMGKKAAKRREGHMSS